jgi:hypothetical protein
VAGGGSIDAGGVFTAGESTGGPFEITASLNQSGMSGTAQVVVTDSVVVTSCKVATLKGYVWAPLQNGALKYIDRTYTFGGVPDKAKGLLYLRTANGDKTSTKDPLVTFAVNLPVRVHILTGGNFDASQGWCAGFESVADPLMGGTVYAKEFGGGEEIRLGPNKGESSMYNVLLEPLAGGVTGTTAPSLALRSGAPIRVAMIHGGGAVRFTGLPRGARVMLFDAKGSLLGAAGELRGTARIEAKGARRVILYRIVSPGIKESGKIDVDRRN